MRDILDKLDEYSIRKKGDTSKIDQDIEKAIYKLKRYKERFTPDKLAYELDRLIDQHAGWFEDVNDDYVKNKFYGSLAIALGLRAYTAPDGTTISAELDKKGNYKELDHGDLTSARKQNKLGFLDQKIAKKYKFKWNDKFKEIEPEKEPEKDDKSSAPDYKNHGKQDYFSGMGKMQGTDTAGADELTTATGQVTSKKDKKSSNWYDKLDPSSKKGKIPVAKISWDGKKVEVPTADNYKEWLKRGQKILDKIFFKYMKSFKKTESQQSIKDLFYLLEADREEEDLQKLWDKYWFTMSKYAKTLPKEAQDAFMRQVDAKEKFDRKVKVAGIKSGPYDDNRDFGRDKIDAERRKEYGAFTEIIQDFKGNPSLDNFKKAIEQATEIDVPGKFYTDMRKLGQFYGMVAKALGLRGLIHFEEGMFQNQQVSFAATQENDFSKSNEEIAPQGMHTTQDANPEKHKDIAQAQFNKGLLPPELAEKFGVDMQAVSGQGSGEKLGTTDRVKKEGFPQPYIVKKGNVSQFGEEGFGAFTKQKFRPAEAWHKDNPKNKHKAILDFSVKGKVFLIIPGKNGHNKFEAEKDDSSTTWYKQYEPVTDERYDRAFKAMGIGVEQDPADSEWNRPRPNPDLASLAQQPKPDLDNIVPGSKASKELNKIMAHLGLTSKGGTTTDALNMYFEAKTGGKLPFLGGDNLKEIIDFSQKRGTQGFFRVFELLKNHANKNESVNRLLSLSGVLTEAEDVEEYHTFVQKIFPFLTGEKNLPYLEDFPYMANLLRSEKTYFEKQGKAKLIRAGYLEDPDKVKPAEPTTVEPTIKPDQSIQGQMQIQVSADKRYILVPASENSAIAKKINLATWGSGRSTIDRQVKDGKIYSKASIDKDSAEVAPSEKVKIIDKRGNPGLYNETISWMNSIGYPPIVPGQAVKPPAEQPAQKLAAEPIQTSIKQQKHPFTGKTSFVIMKTDPKTGKQKRASQEEFSSQEKAQAFLQNWQLGPTGWQRKDPGADANERPGKSNAQTPTRQGPDYSDQGKGSTSDQGRRFIAVPYTGQYQKTSNDHVIKDRENPFYKSSIYPNKESAEKAANSMEKTPSVYPKASDTKEENNKNQKNDSTDFTRLLKNAGLLKEFY